MNCKKSTFLLFFCFFFLLSGYLVYRYDHSFSSRVRNRFCTSASFSIDGEPSGVVLHPFETDSGFVVVLPSHWEETMIIARYEDPAEKEMWIDNQIISSFWRPLNVRIGESFSLRLSSFLPGSQNVLRLTFCKSKLDAIFIDTESGSTEFIDKSKDKSHTESGQLLAISNNGQIHYQGRLESIRGRGNTTWNLYKKPYSIKIARPSALFGLKKAKKFNLLANCMDETSLRNWLMFHTAKLLNIPYSIDATFVSLFLNGHYKGLYQLTNKVDIGESGIDIYDLEKETKKMNKKLDKYLTDLPTFSIDRNDTVGLLKGIDQAENPSDITGGYLLETNFKLHRYAKSISGFIPRYGYPVEIKAPELATHQQVDYISNYYNEMLDAVRSEDGVNPTTGKHYSDYMDVDSYIKCYLCSEFFYNHDALFSSFYMYKDKGKKMFCGPLWDYDLSLNTKYFFEESSEYDSFFVREAREKDGSLMMFGQLYKHPEYRNRLIQIFNEQFKPIILSYTAGIELDSVRQSIAEDLSFNNLKWQRKHHWWYNNFQQKHKTLWNNRGLSEIDEIEQNGDYWNIKNFMQKRLAFLSSIWQNTESEKNFTKINWDYGFIESFKFHSLVVAFLLKEEPFIWPRFILKDKKRVFNGVVDAYGEPVKDGETSDYLIIKYKTPEND